MARRVRDEETDRMISFMQDLIAVACSERVTKGLSGRIHFEFYFENGKLTRTKDTVETNRTEPPRDWTETGPTHSVG